MQEAPLQIASYRLGRHIGRGGFSEVWQATHPDSRATFAIKVLRGDFGENRAMREAFVREADAVARLSHRCIVALHDYGEVPEFEDAASSKLLVAGMPYLVMKYFPDGPVQDFRRLTWNEVHRLLHDVLLGLAHAHARSILHLDVKPQNVLRERTERQVRFVVGDFGTAALLDRIALGASKRDHTEGTPLYMAPERLFGREFDVGPWSDLYSLAVMAWVLLAGRSPFSVRTASEIMNAHAREGIPVLPMDVAVPAPFHTWLARCARRDPAQRFTSASEARAALEDAVGLVPDADFGGTDGKTTASGEQSGRIAEVYATTLFVAERPVIPILPTKASPRALTIPVRIPIPDSIEMLDLDGASEQALTFGTGLLGRRDPPLVARLLERESLWRTFREVIAKAAPRIVLLEGAAGAGKTRLARWLAESAAEHCGAISLMATHAEVTARADGLAAMIARGLRAQVADPADLQQWATQLMMGLGTSNVYDIDTLADLVAAAIFPGDTRVPWRVRLKDRKERHEVIERLLRRLAATRPVVLVIDDLQWAPSALALLERIANDESERTFPITIVATVRSETRDDDPETWDRICTLAGRPIASTLPVAPQSIDEIVRVVTSTFALERHSARVLAEQAGGSPLMALQILDAWFHEGALQPVRGGWALGDDAVVNATPAMPALWEQRLDRAIATIPESLRTDALAAIERAAALGTNISDVDWRALCADLDGAALDIALDTMQARGLCVFHPGTWSFAHALLPQAIEARAQREGRASVHHTAIARWLASSTTHQTVPISDRVATHLERAACYAEAFDVTYRIFQVDALTEQIAFRMWIRRLERCAAKLTSDEARDRLPLLQVRQLQFRQQRSAATAESRAEFGALRESLHASANDLALWELDFVELEMLDAYANAAEYLTRCRDLYDRATTFGEMLRRVRAAGEVAQQLDMQNQTKDQISFCLEARNWVPTDLRTTHSYSVILHCLVHGLFDAGFYHEGVEVLQELDAIVRTAATRETLGSTYMLRCEALIRFGQFEAAAAALDEAADIAYTMSNSRDILCHVHRCALFARSGDWESCIASMDAARAASSRPRSRGLIVGAVAYASVALARTGARDRWDELMPSVIADVVAWEYFESIMMRCYADAGLAWLDQGEAELAEVCLRLALTGLVRPNDGAASARIEAVLANPDDRDRTAPPFLDEVAQVLDGCPDWLLEPYPR